MTALNLGDVADGTVTVRVGGAEPFDLQVTAGVADVPDEHLAAVLAVFSGAHVAEPDLGPPAGPTDITLASPATQEPPA